MQALPPAKFSMNKYRATSLMQPHNFRQALRDAKAGAPPVMGYYMAAHSVQSARYIATLGYDFVWIDPEHSPVDIETMTDIIHTLQFMSEGRTSAVVRVPGHDHAWIGFALDAGAGAIVVPQVDTAEQARHVCSYATFGAKRGGTRSMPPFRLLPGITDLAPEGKSCIDTWNDHPAIIVQIESMEGVNNIEEICKIDRIDCIWVGTLDLRVSMGLPTNMGAGSEPEFLEAVAKVKAVAEKYGKAWGGFAMPQALELMAKDKHFLVMASDAFFFRQLAEELSSARAVLQEPRLKVGNGHSNGHSNGN